MCSFRFYQPFLISFEFLDDVIGKQRYCCRSSSTSGSGRIRSDVFKLKEISEYNLAKLTISYRSVDILWDTFDFVEGRWA